MNHREDYVIVVGVYEMPERSYEKVYWVLAATIEI